MDLESLRKLAAEHPYVLLALAIGLIVRLLKSDTKLPIEIPPRYRKLAAVLLAAGGAVVEKLALGVPTGTAIVDGILAWVLVEFGHYFVVDKLRGGKELPVPFLMVPGAPPSPGKPPSIPPKKGPPNLPPGVSAMLCAFVLMGLVNLAGCTKFWKVADLLADKVNCVVANQDLPDETIFLKCAIEEPERYLEVLKAAREETKKAVSREMQKASSDRSDAGCPGTK